MTVIDTILLGRDATPPIPPTLESPYNYIPSEAAGIAFLVVFGLSTFAHAYQAGRYSNWYLYPTVVLAGLLEILGWTGRLWSSYSPMLKIPFQLQICCTILAPTPLVAAMFILLGRIISHLGPQYSRIPARLYAIIFLSADFISLIVQAVGGGLAATAETLPGANRGGNIMLGGIALQLAMMLLYFICAVEFLIRYTKDTPVPGSIESTRGVVDSNLKTLFGGLIFAFITLLIRAVYRTIELSDGWTGKIIANQTLFIVFDGVMVALAMYTFNIIHPGRLLVGAVSPKASDAEVGDKESSR